MNTFTVAHTVVANVQLEVVSLRPILGAYELVFGVVGTSTTNRTQPASLEVQAARVEVRYESGNSAVLGTARPDAPVRILQQVNAAQIAIEFRLLLPPGQLGALEELRNGGDLSFQLTVIGSGAHVSLASQLYRSNDSLFKSVPRSDWIKQMREAKAMDVLLLEIPLAYVNPPVGHRELIQNLEQARKLFYEGHYTESVLHCRKVVEALGHAQHRTRFWASEALQRLSRDREAMASDERLTAMQAALHHFTNPAAHAASMQFTRGQAKMALALSAAFVAQTLQP